MNRFPAATASRAWNIRVNFSIGAPNETAFSGVLLLRKQREVIKLGWTDVDLTKINTQPEILPEKTFTWELAPGSKYTNEGGISCSATIVNDGEHTGRRTFFSYPDPDSFDKNGNKNEWSAVALARLFVAMGIDLVAGEDPVATLNRASGSRFIAPIKHSKPTEEYPNPRANLKTMYPKPAA